MIIIPDVHGRDFWRKAVEENPGKKFIFLGDYLDPYPWEGITVDQAWQGLQDIVAFKKRNPGDVTLLWGNHDLHYIYPDLRGSRYDDWNAGRNAVFFEENKSLFKYAHEVVTDGGTRILFSHAGIGRKWILGCFPALGEEEITADLFNDLADYGPFEQALCEVSYFRGGSDPYGSLLWADAREQTYPDNRLPGCIQVFGHTQMDAPDFMAGEFYCLDCRQAFFLDCSDGAIYFLEDGTRVE